ncbi:MAG: hypothetical protein LBE98_01555 [Puniceicoccales bacterium]|jgi:hypothetical protein|nr:hypothetical protein [Puniceicoccales bacterium]
MTIALAIVVVVIPTIREYRAAGGNRGMIKAIPVVAWMMVTRPFRLAYRILTVITGGAEVDRLQLQQSINQLKGLRTTVDNQLTLKQQAVTHAIAAIVADPALQGALDFAFNAIHNNTNAIVQRGSLDNYKIQWEFLQATLRDRPGNANVQAVKTALDEWEQYLNMRISIK